MATPFNIQLYYRCEECKNASDEHGRGCKVNLLRLFYSLWKIKLAALGGRANTVTNNQTDNDYVKDL